ncbi:MAG: DUF1150 domain-containing protein [Pseudomonadota bacterium]
MDELKGFFKTGGGDASEVMSDDALAALGAPNMVYVRQVAAADVADDLEGEDENILTPGSQTLYAVHAANGDRLALVSDRETAFVAARQYEMEPVSVH